MVNTKIAQICIFPSQTKLHDSEEMADFLIYAIHDFQLQSEQRRRLWGVRMM